MADVRETPGASGLPAVAVAIVAGDLGALVGRRRDGLPPWTSPGGKIEPGESPEDAAVRETLKETGATGPGDRGDRAAGAPADRRPDRVCGRGVGGQGGRCRRRT